MTDLPSSVLLVDSDGAFAEDASRFLEAHGYLVTHCDSLNAARSRLRGRSPDVVMTEANLTDESGYTLLQVIKQSDPMIPVIFCSAPASASDVVEALRAGVTDYLLKPIEDFDVMLSVLDKAQRWARLEREHAEAQRALLKMNRELNQSLYELERDQSAGRMVQQKLSPLSPVVYGDFQVSYRIVPSLYLSGDAIDYGLLNGRYLAFYLTDIAGHGSASAFVAVWVKQLVRSFFRDQRIFHSRRSFIEDAPRLMQLINRELLKNQIGTHLTCLVGVIDTHTNELNYVVGGHLPLPILVTESGEQVLSGRGKPLGLFEDANWELNTVELPPSFSLLVFSDGALELMDAPGLVEKESSLTRLMAAAKPKTLAEVAQGLALEKVDTVPDDVAMLLIRRD